MAHFSFVQRGQKKATEAHTSSVPFRRWAAAFDDTRCREKANFFLRHMSQHPLPLPFHTGKDPHAKRAVRWFAKTRKPQKVKSSVGKFARFCAPMLCGVACIFMSLAGCVEDAQKFGAVGEFCRTSDDCRPRLWCFEKACIDLQTWVEPARETPQPTRQNHSASP